MAQDIPVWRRQLELRRKPLESVGLMDFGVIAIVWLGDFSHLEAAANWLQRMFRKRRYADGPTKGKMKMQHQRA